MLPFLPMFMLSYVVWQRLPCWWVVQYSTCLCTYVCKHAFKVLQPGLRLNPHDQCLSKEVPDDPPFRALGRYFFTAIARVPIRGAVGNGNARNSDVGPKKRCDDGDGWVSVKAQAVW